MKKEEIPSEVLEAMYVIMCSIPFSMLDKGAYAESWSYEVYDEAREPMRKAQQWVLDWGKSQNIDSRGRNLNQNKEDE